MEVAAASLRATLSNVPTLTIPLVLLILVIVFKPREKQPPSLPDKIPFISNTLQYLTDPHRFLTRAITHMTPTNILTFRLGPVKVYCVQKPHNILPLLRVTNDFSSEGFMVMTFRGLWDLDPVDIAKFSADKSGRLKKPASPFSSSSSSSTTNSKRYWYAERKLYEEFLSRGAVANTMTDKYADMFSQRLGEQPLHEWATVSLFKWVKKHMTDAAVVSLIGPRILQQTPDFSDLFWDFDSNLFYLIMGPPKWLNRHPWRVHKAFHDAVARYVETAWREFNWDGPDAESDWEPVFGARVARELQKWCREAGFSDRTVRGFVAMLITAQNSNPIPLLTWALYEVVRDGELFAAVRKEVDTAWVVDDDDGGARGERRRRRRRRLDFQKLTGCVLLNSVVVEIFRLHDSPNVVREVNKEVVMEGFTIKRGSYIQGITKVGHYDEGIWGIEGHPASEFWAGRHLESVTLGPELGVAGKPGAFVPFGGGTGACPGRFLAKQEILVGLAMIVSRFDVEFVEWTHLDGKPSDRAAQDDPAYAGAVAVSPDREMKVRWKRLW
ncbi:hypothetical protein OQA88_9925 [Cercophora sp. LCS_1]